jgi:predicted transcriptional regulator
MYWEESMEENSGQQDWIDHTVQLVSAYVSKNSVGSGDLPALIQDVHRTLRGLTDAPVEVSESPKPVVPINKSITPEYLICLEDGKRLKMLKRHLMTVYNMTPQEYREKWSLPSDYPMVAPNYARKRSQLAKRIGLGGKRSG